MNPVSDFGWRHQNVTADTLVHTGAGVLHTIVLNGLTTAGDAVLYDGVDAGGVVIGTLHLVTTTSISVQPITLLYDVKVATGIFVDFDNTLVADLTVTFN